MLFLAIRFGMVASIALAVQAGAMAEDAAKAEDGSATALSADFWSDFKTYRDGAGFSALNKAAGSAGQVKAAITQGQKAHVQSIATVAVDRPADVANLLTSFAASPASAENPEAVATVLAMRTTARDREAAAPLVAPAARAQVAAFTANLTTGIAGLPGIYLGHAASVTGGRRAAAPAGYAAVPGGSMGCAAR